MTSLHRHETASLGLRAGRLTGEGTEHGRLVRLILLAATRWPGRAPQDPWHSNAKLATLSGLEERQVEVAIACLRRAGVVTTRKGPRPGAKPGRLIAMGLHAPVKAIAPSGFDVRNLWAFLRAHRSRPAALVTMVVGAFMLASDAAGEAIDEWSALGCSANALRRFVGQADGPSWTARLRELEQLGLIRREGREVFVSPPRAWFSLAVDAAEDSLRRHRAAVDHERAEQRAHMLRNAPHVPVLKLGPAIPRTLEVSRVGRRVHPRTPLISTQAERRDDERVAELVQVPAEHDEDSRACPHADPGRQRDVRRVRVVDQRRDDAETIDVPERESVVRVLEEVGEQGHGGEWLRVEPEVEEVTHGGPNRHRGEVFPDPGIVAGRIGPRAREPADYALPPGPLLRVRLRDDADELQTGTGDVVARSRGRPT